MAIPTLYLVAIGTALVVLTAGLWLWRRKRFYETAAQNARIAGLSAQDGIVVQDRQGRVLWVNPAYCEMMGRTEEEILGRNPLSYCMPIEEQPTDAEIAAFRYAFDAPDGSSRSDGTPRVWRNQRKDGSIFWNQISISFHRGRYGDEKAVLVCRDVTDDIKKEKALKRNAEKLRQMASRDVLTGAANRASLEAFVAERLEQRRAGDGTLGLLQIDLDNFKAINDQHGHAAGDELLQHVTRACLGTLRDSDMLARIGGDEFVVACTGISDREGLLKVGHGIRAAIQTPLIWEGRRIPCDASIGAVLSETPADTLSNLMRRADLALYDVKRRGRGDVAIFDERLKREDAHQTRWTKALKDAISGNGLVFQYQPIIAIETGEVICFETLVRWRQYDGSLLQPVNFLPLANDLGVESKLDGQAARAAATLQAKLCAAGRADVFVTFNCSPRTLSGPGFAADLVKIVERAGIPPAAISPEIDESVLLGGTDGKRPPTEALTEIAEAGFSIVVDDFRQGFVTLPDLPFALFKCDRHLTDRIGTSQAGTVIASSLLSLGRDLGYRMALKGIEDTDQLERIKSAGGVLLQAHHIAPPMSEEETLDWLIRSPRERAPSVIAPAYQHR